MPVLDNPRKELVCQERAAGSTQVDSYETGGFAPHDSSACRMLGQAKMKERVAEIQKDRAQRLDRTVEGHLDRLMDRAKLATEAGHHSTAMRGEELFGKVNGFYVDRLKLEGEATPEQTAQAIVEMLGPMLNVAPEVAVERLIAAMGADGDAE